MPTYADLEICLYRLNEKQYGADLRHNPAESDAEQRLSPPDGAPFGIDLPALRAHEPNWPAYGAALRDAVFRDRDGRPNDLAQAFRDARNMARSVNAILRVRLLIQRDASELSEVHWETIVDPEDSSGTGTLFTSPELAFSRYVTSSDLRPVRSRPRAELKALVVIASPGNISSFPAGNRPLEEDEDAPRVMLAPIDAPAELAQAREALGAIEVHSLAQPGQATLDNIVRKLSEGYDILYLICHGALRERAPGAWEARLYLEDSAGKTAVASGTEFVRRIEQLPERPRLIVLASCQSAGTGVDAVADAQPGARFGAAVGPRLAVAGVPAVIAMRGNIGMETAAVFMRTFFTELARDGQIDRAVAAARQTVAGEPDFWVPVLYLRLRSGLIWYVPGFNVASGSQSLEEQWDGICRAVSRGTFVPIIGPELPEFAFGSAADAAAELAEERRSPMSAWENADLAKVAQFIQSTLSITELQNAIRDVWLRRVCRRYMHFVPEDYPDCDARTELPNVLSQILDEGMKREDNPYRILATELKKASVYVDANADPLMALALRRAGRAPIEVVSRWRDERRDDDTPERSAEEQMDPKPEKPILFYPYGNMDSDDTWIITEDDYFDYLIRTSKHDLLPLNARSKLTLSTLIFLGFQLSDWKFRILFRLIWNQGGSEKFRRNLHVAVQVNPDGTTKADAIRAKKYLETYFSEAKVNIFWGTAADFLRELDRQLKLYRARNLERLAGAAR